MTDLDFALDALHRLARPSDLEGMARFGMSTDRRLGVRVPEIRKLARSLPKRTDLAVALWDSGLAEARILASLVADPAQLSVRQMDLWVADLDSWDVCDQLCMNCLDRSPHAWQMVERWAEREEEFVKRAGFALLACLAWHDKHAADDRFLAFLPLIERQAHDGRNYVKKAVSWALRHIGKRNPALHEAAIDLAGRLASSPDRTARWIGNDAVRDLKSASTARKMDRLRSR